MQNTTIEKVKKGDFFRLAGKKTVYVAKGYNASIKKYEYCRYDDMNAYSSKKKGTLVEIDFEF